MSTWSEEIQSTQESPDPSIFSNAICQISNILKSYTYFNLAFATLGLSELICLLIFFNTLTRSSLLALTLAIFLMTLFCYFILRIYYQNKRPEQLHQLAQKTLKELQSHAQKKNSIEDQSLWLASTLSRLSHSLHDLEYELYKPKKNFTSLSYSYEKLGCWLHFKDLHRLKEWFYFEAIKQYIELIKHEPDNLQYHIALANTYLLLSSLYSPAKFNQDQEDDRWIHPISQSEEMQEKFLQCARRTVEEFKILNDYRPNDPWIYTQLAYCYHDLLMPKEEIEAYEKVLKLNSEDTETQFKLGVLYFQSGQNAKGLKMYEKLKPINPQKADKLIGHYQAWNLFHL